MRVKSIQEYTNEFLASTTVKPLEGEALTDVAKLAAANAWTRVADLTANCFSLPLDQAKLKIEHAVSGGVVMDWLCVSVC